MRDMLISPPPVAPDVPARERILWTAGRLFYADGVRATGIDRVIAQAGVTKVTFYRHFPSKNDLVRAFLADRHARWMSWFDAALRRHGDTLAALVPAMAQWLGDEGFRGCAFLNTSGELIGDLPEVGAITSEHKAAVIARLQTLSLDAAGPRTLAVEDAALLCAVMDGAIARALYEGRPDGALAALARAVTLLVR